MHSNLPRIVDAFAGLNVVVIGEAILDSYLEGTASRICREAPVPIVTLEERKDAPGGAANTAVNVHALGGRVTFLSVVGDDLEGQLLRQALSVRGVPAGHVLEQRGRRTLAKHRVVAGAHMLVRFDQGSTESVVRKTEQALIDHLADLYPRCDAVIVSDYGYGIITPRVLKALTELQSRTPRVLVVDSKNLPAYRNVGVTAVKPNFEELVELLGTQEFDGFQPRAIRVAQLGDRILDMTGAQVAAVTMDTDGSLLIERSNPPYRTYARPAANSRAAGAGDTYVSALTLALAAGAETPSVAELASAAAAIVVSKEGTAACSADELRELGVSGSKYFSSASRLAARAELYREQGQRVVFTNGCFDILHRGHINFLNRAKSLGDVLIVGVNSDDSVHRLKGAGRPINTIEDRIGVLTALSCIDHIVAFEEDTPASLIRAIRPDVFVKGGNYTRETLPEARIVEELGGAVHILPYLHDRTTTHIIRRIRETSPFPAVEVPQSPTREEPQTASNYEMRGEGDVYHDRSTGAA